MRTKSFRWAVRVAIRSAAVKSAALMLAAYLAPAAWPATSWADPPQPVETRAESGVTKTPKQETDELLRNLERKAEPKFLRIRKNAQGEPISLQTATVRYVPEAAGREMFVDLIGVVHVGDRGYYQQLNDQFEQYDALLYELVAPPGSQIPKKEKKSDNPIAIAQSFLKTLLDLEHQLESIDYKAENFVHADLTPDEMSRLIRERGDNALTLTLGVASDFLRAGNLAQLKAQQEQLATEGPQTPEEMLKFVLNPVKLKRTMARQFDAMETDAALGNTLDQILVRDRNQACMKVMHDQLEMGRRKLGVFYGAAHMPDMERRLLEKYKLKRQSVTWQTAWDLRDRGNGEPGLEDVLRLLKPLLEE